MDELIALLGEVAGDVQSSRGLGVLAVSAVVAKYSVDILRAAMVQRLLAWVERKTGAPAGSLQWRAWSDRTRVLVTLGQSFVVGALASLAAGAEVMTAVGAGVMAAVGAKGLHDTGVVPGRRPSKRGPATVIDRKPRSESVSRGLSLKVDVSTGKVSGGGPRNAEEQARRDETTSPRGQGPDASI